MISILSSPAYSFNKVGSALAKVLGGIHYPNSLQDGGAFNEVIIVGNPNVVTQRISNSFSCRRLVFYIVTEGTVTSDVSWLKDKTVVVPSRYVKEKLEESGVRVAEIIPHTVGNFSYPKRRNLRNLLYIAGYRPDAYGRRKYPEYGITALDTIRAKVNAITTNNNPFSRSLNIMPSIHSLSNLQLNRAYQRNNFYLNLSDAEGFGLTILEAMSNGLVIITPEYAPITEFTNKSFTIYVPVKGTWHEPYSPSNTGNVEHHYYAPEDMANAVAKALTLDDHLYSHMSEESLKQARKFCPGAYLKFLEFLV